MAFSAGHSHGDGNLEKKWIAEYVCLGPPTPQWIAIPDVAGDLVSFLSTWLHTAMCQCVREFTQMWFINTSLKPSKFPAITISWQGFSMGKRRGVFFLQQALFSPRSPGHRTPAGTRLIMHPVWRRGQSGTLRSIIWQSKLFSNIHQVVDENTDFYEECCNCFAVYMCLHTCLNCVLYSYESNSTLLNQPILGTSC